MCLGIPMKVVHVDGFLARCVAEGVERDVNLMLVSDEAITVGDFVLVHLGNAIRTLSEEEFDDAWEVLREMAPAPEAPPG